ncbi:MAG: hypothetical protein CL920_07910 [Deltaproteobacteria bacterium]|nr:hypothetical protein [Deltaproteobacteria bacterium]MBU48604.1 hypothetical protein [Deltaproteobacteria bacterium]|tara:strand:+ start:25534 stop:27036 length:1503 start_codon:yes stop_codon:yes gene_type:complete
MSSFSVVIFASENMTRRYPMRWLRIALCKQLLSSEHIEIKGLFIDRPPAAPAKSLERYKKKYGEEAFYQFLELQALEPSDTETPFSYVDACQALDIPCYEMDLNSDETHALLTELQPDLGVLFGCRILHESIVDAPTFGTLNFHARDAEKFRGGGALGYWELLEDERDIQITIHRAVAKVDAGQLLTTSRLEIEPCDTLESLLLKTVIRGVDVYAQSIIRFAEGHREMSPQQTEQAKTYRRDLLAETFFRKERQQVLSQMDRYRDKKLPELWAPAPKQVTPTQPTVFILSYPLIANHPSHPTNIPYEVFVGQLQWLQRYFRCISLSDALKQLRGEDVPSDNGISFVLTLDGGFAQDSVVVLPFLRAFELPATLLVSPQSIEDSRTMCGQALFEWEALYAEVERASLDVGLLSPTHFDHEQLDSFDFVGEQTLLESWLRRKCEVAALPYKCNKDIPEGPGIWLRTHEAPNTPAHFDGRQLARIVAPSSVGELAERIEGMFW